ncbi:hypothetical protein L0128_02920 [candidate division KSB1 bacterium]|nr:hypothetical protein [candidate division KSB1 bacterium]
MPKGRWCSLNDPPSNDGGKNHGMLMPLNWTELPGRVISVLLMIVLKELPVVCLYEAGEAKI